MDEFPPPQPPIPESAGTQQPAAAGAARPGGLTRRFVISAAAFFAAGVAAIVLIPQLDPVRYGGTQPGFVTFFGVGLVLILLTGGLIAIGLRSDYGAMPMVLIYTFAYNSLLVLVKFVVAPASVYAFNLRYELKVFIDFPVIYLGVITIGIFALYAVAFWFLHGLISAQVLPDSGSFWSWLLPVLIFGILMAIGGWLLFAWAGPLDYVVYLLFSPLAIFIALALAGAVALASKTIKGIGRQTALIRDTTLLASFLWVGLAFIALYHVLWFVYMLVIVSIWPLRTVTPK